MKTMNRTLAVIALLSLGMLQPVQVRADEECVKEDTACCMPGTAFCLTEKTKADPTFFLSDEARTDIGITDEQMQRIRELTKSTCEAIEKEAKDLKRPEKGASEQQCAEFRKEMKAICQKHFPQCREKLGEILNKTQMEKLETRMFQYYGFAPCSIALGVLQLTPEQKKQLEKVAEELGESIHQCVAGSGKIAGNEEQIREKIVQCRAECAAKVKKILTKEQLEKGEQLLMQTPMYVKRMQESHRLLKTASQKGETIR